MITAGLGLGLCGAWLVSQALSGTLYGVDTPLAPMIGATALLCLAAWIGISVPTRRAVKVDPAVTLKQD